MTADLAWKKTKKRAVMAEAMSRRFVPPYRPHIRWRRLVGMVLLLMVENMPRTLTLTRLDSDFGRQLFVISLAFVELYIPSKPIRNLVRGRNYEAPTYSY